MALDWTQVTMMVSTAAAAFGTSLGIPIANALRRPGIDKAIDKKVDAESSVLAARIDEIERVFAGRGAELAYLRQRVQFLEQAILGWKPRASETPTVPPPVVETERPE